MLVKCSLDQRSSDFGYISTLLSLRRKSFVTAVCFLDSLAFCHGTLQSSAATMRPKASSEMRLDNNQPFDTSDTEDRAMTLMTYSLGLNVRLAT